MADLKGTKTEANLQTAFAGESMARNKYTYFASKAKKDGYVQIAKIFDDDCHHDQPENIQPFHRDTTPRTAASQGYRAGACK